MSRNLSTASVPQTAFVVKTTVLPILPDGVTLSTDGLYVERRCPACGQTGRVGVYPGRLAESLQYITRRAWVCKSCEEDMAANFLSWELTPEAGDYDYSLAWQEFRREFCHE